MILRIGMSGDEVRKLQEELNLWGEKLTVDGQFGPNTEKGIQRFQSSVGIPVDGAYGPQTARALTEKVKYLRPAPPVLITRIAYPESNAILTPVSGSAIVSQPTQEVWGDKVHMVYVDMLDERSEKNLAALLPPVQKKAREFMMACIQAGVPVKIICGLRTYAEQTELYAQGRTQPGSIVTYAKAGFSNHHWGSAFDIGVFDPEYKDESPWYDKAGEIGKSVGLEWGGDWKGKKCDKPHFQWPLEYSPKVCREMMARNEWPPAELLA